MADTAATIAAQLQAAHPYWTVSEIKIGVAVQLATGLAPTLTQGLPNSLTNKVVIPPAVQSLPIPMRLNEIQSGMASAGQPTQEGDLKISGGVVYQYKNGSWVYLQAAPSGALPETVRPADELLPLTALETIEALELGAEVGAATATTSSGFLASIISAFNSVSSGFYSIYLVVLGWIYPFWLAASPFYQLSLLFNTLAWQFSYFQIWANDVASKVSGILSWNYIKSLILGWLPWLPEAVTWFQSWWNNVTSAVTSWWSATSVTVKGWVTAATQYLNGVATAWNNFWNNTWPQWSGILSGLQSAWDNFWKVTFPTLVSFNWLSTWWGSRLQDVQNLINSGFATRDSFWAGWQDLRNEVATFFADPLTWLWERFEDWFFNEEVE